MLDDLGGRLDVPIHHGGGGTHADLMRGPMHIEPRLGPALLDGDALAYARRQDLRAAARQRALAGLVERLEDAPHVEPAHLHHLVDLGGREEVRRDLGVTLARFAHDGGVERPRDLGVQAALQEHGRRADLAGALHHLHDAFDVVRVTIGRGLADFAVERAEVTVHGAVVRVVGIRVDHVRDDARVGPAHAHFVRERAELDERGFREQVDTLFTAQTLAAGHLVFDAIPHGSGAPRVRATPVRSDRPIGTYNDV